MIYVSFVLLVAIIASVHGQNASFPDCKSGPLATFPICDQSLPARQRAADTISRMNNSAAALPCLDLPQYQWWSEALHAVAKSPGIHFGGDLSVATSFPIPINYGTTFNMSLVHAVATVTFTGIRSWS